MKSSKSGTLRTLRSPSPQPSPLGRGRQVPHAGRLRTRLDLGMRSRRSSLSLKEKVGARGKEAALVSRRSSYTSQLQIQFCSFSSAFTVFGSLMIGSSTWNYSKRASRIGVLPTLAPSLPRPRSMDRPQRGPATRSLPPLIDLSRATAHRHLP